MTQFTITIFPNEQATSKQEHRATLDELREAILGPYAAEKAALPFLKLAVFGDKADPKSGSLRYDANVREVHGVELDYDGKEKSLAEAAEIIARLNLKCVLYTSPSYTEDAPKWRILCPTSRPLPPAERGRLARGVNELFGGIFDNASFTLSQSYYFGSVSPNGGPNPDHICQVFEGDCVDEIELPAVEVKEAPPIQPEDTAEPESDSQSNPWNAEEERRLREALDRIPADEKTLKEKFGNSHQVFVKIGRALERLGWGEQGFAIWRDWCKRNPEKFNEAGLRTQWKSFGNHRNDAGAKVTTATIYMYADMCTASSKAPPQEEPRSQEEPPPDEMPLPIDTAPEYSEEAIALEFATRNAGKLRYVAKWNQWLVWDGTCWREDEKRNVYTIARGICREMATTIITNSTSERKRLASAKTRAAVVSLAGEDLRLAASIDQWDTDPWLLNTPEGVVDLRTGKMRAHRPEDYMTKCTTVSPGGECPKWKVFIAEITGGDEELARYLQRIAGYCLTGVTHEQQLFFLYGTGCNGKGVFVNTIAGILGDYHRATGIETFTVSHNERHPTELAGLRGARLVTAAETEDGRRWAEARIKELTGGDKITARFMRQDFFTYEPQFKLVFSGNHMPVLRTISKAITRRFNRIPFTVTIPAEKVNVHLVEELKEERGGILAWLIEGCLAWQREGLKPPAAVLAATNQYLEGQDVLGDWLDEDCDIGGDCWEPRARLYEVWSKWAEDRGEYAGGNRWFSQKLEDRGFVPRKGAKGVRGFGGLKLKQHTLYTNPQTPPRKHTPNMFEPAVASLPPYGEWADLPDHPMPTGKPVAGD
jgi:putative DNA primase/helicase